MPSQSERDFRALRAEYADLLHAHTRAIWALTGEVDYPEDERAHMGKHAQAVLLWANGRIGDDVSRALKRLDEGNVDRARELIEEAHADLQRIVEYLNEVNHGPDEPYVPQLLPGVEEGGWSWPFRRKGQSA